MLRFSHRSVALAGFFGFLLLGLWGWHYSHREAQLGLNEQSGELSFASSADPWIISPTEIGSDLPPKGASLFDRLFTKVENGKAVYDIPYPFEKIVERLEQNVGKAIDPARPAGPKGLLIPLGRSLQRNAAVADDTNVKDLNPYFQFPRVVLGMDEEIPVANGAVGEHLRDRFFIGFHEKAQVLEVVSYNEDSGRFEFQIVRDYNDRRNAKVFYAQRSLCLSCHQNQSPIFAKQPWNEMNAHQAIIDRLVANIKTDADRPGYYHGVPVKIGLTTPYAFDNSTDRANFIIPTQRLWSRMCTTPECRTQVLLSMLLRSVAKPQNLAPELDRNFVDEMARAFKAQYPAGMWIPNPNVLNRDPLTDSRGATAAADDLLKGKKDTGTLSTLLKRSLVSAEFEPLQARPALETWNDLSLNPGGQMDRFLAGVADQFPFSDFRQIDQLIFDFGQASDQEKLACNWEVVSGVLSSPNFALDGLCQSPNFEVGVFVEVKNNEVAKADMGDIKVKSALCERVSKQMTATSVGAGKACLTFSQKRVSAKFERADGQVRLRFAFWDKDNLHLRTPRGNSFLNLEAEVPQTLTGSGDGPGRGGVAMDWEKFKDWMRPFLAKNQDLLKSPTIPRFELISRILADTQRLTKDTRPDRLAQNQMERHIENPIDGLPPDFSGSPLKSFVRSCAVCHRNSEGVPPNFLGGPQLSLSSSQICERISKCAPRMLYRIKMRLCSDTDQKLRRSPMPPPHAFFGFLNDDEETWTKETLPVLIGQLTKILDADDLTRAIQAKGIAANEAAGLVKDLLQSPCPIMKGADYQRLLPSCDFAELPDAVGCLQILEK